MFDCSVGLIRSQVFYKNIDWDRLELKQMDSLFKLKIVSSFDLKIFFFYFYFYGQKFDCNLFNCYEVSL